MSPNNKIIVLVAALVTFGLGGCGISAQYLKADAATYRAVAPRYSAYLKTDAALSEEERRSALDTVETWRLRIEKNGGLP